MWQLRWTILQDSKKKFRDYSKETPGPDLAKSKSRNCSVWPQVFRLRFSFLVHKGASICNKNQSLTTITNYTFKPALGIIGVYINARKRKWWIPFQVSFSWWHMSPLKMCLSQLFTKLFLKEVFWDRLCQKPTIKVTFVYICFGPNYLPYLFANFFCRRLLGE